MFESLANLFNSQGFMPHGHCFLWRTDLVYLHVISDALIAVAYFAIPTILLYFLHRRKDVVFSWIFVMFAVFILACGLTHAMSIWTLWNPDYLEQGLLKGLTALVSVITAIALIPILPKIIDLPSPKQLLEANERLNEEINERTRIEKNLAENAKILKSKAEELDKLNGELSRVNKIFTGREQRMLELKERINKLLEEKNMPAEFNLTAK